MTTTKKTGGRARTAAERASDGVEVPELSEEELEALATEDEPDEDTGPIAEDGSIRPVEIGKRGREGGAQVHIFTLNGTKFFIPKKPNRAILLRFWSQAQNSRQGVNVATQNALVALLGQDALDNLANSPLTTDEDVADVFSAASHVFFGAINTMAEERKAAQLIADPSKRGPKKRRG